MRILIITISILLFFQHCADDSPVHIRYQKDDFWLDNFRNNSYPSKAFKDDKIYCSSLEHSDSNYLYCLNVKTGKVDWAVSVKQSATCPPIISDSFIYYCSYVGDIYKFDKQGNQLWFVKLNSPYAEHCINPVNGNLIVRTVTDGLREFNSDNGELVDAVGKGMMKVTLPVFSEDKIFMAGLNDSLVCRKNISKEPIWQIKTGRNISRLFLIRDRIYYFDDTQSLNCVNARNGHLLWQSDKLFATWPLSPKLLIENGKIICYFTDLYNLYLLDPENGKLLQKNTAENLQHQGYLIPETKLYKVYGDNKTIYTVFVENELVPNFFGSSYGIRIKKQATP